MFEEMVAAGFVTVDFMWSGPLEDLYNMFVAWVETGITWEIIGSQG